MVRKCCSVVVGWAWTTLQQVLPAGAYCSAHASTKNFDEGLISCWHRHRPPLLHCDLAGGAAKHCSQHAAAAAAATACMHDVRAYACATRLQFICSSASKRRALLGLTPGQIGQLAGCFICLVLPPTFNGSGMACALLYGCVCWYACCDAHASAIPHACPAALTSTCAPHHLQGSCQAVCASSCGATTCISISSSSSSWVTQRQWPLLAGGRRSRRPRVPDGRDGLWQCGCQFYHNTAMIT